MTWKNAQRDARARLEMLIQANGLRSLNDLAGVRVPLVEYASQQDLDDLTDNAGAWSLDYHNMVMRAAARIVERHGGRAIRTRLSRQEYERWLATTNRSNSPTARAEFAALVSS